jgi:DNA-binding response OmpR family regulator
MAMSQGLEPPPFEQSAKAKTILVVEDDIGIGSFLVQAISQETAYQAVLAFDAFQALNVTESIKPIMFLLDYQLPRMNGIELYDRLHSSQGLEDVPAILISARLPKAEIEKRKIIGMHKPLELDELLDTIERLLS